MRKKVLLVGPIHQSGVDVLTPDCEVRLAEDISAAGLAEAARNANGIIVRTAPLPASVIDAAPCLEVIARHGVGVDNIDVRAASRRGIPVVNTPEANTQSVAEHTLGLIIALAKRLPQSERAARTGAWEVRERLLAIDLEGKVLGVIGTGRIGMSVAGKASLALGMRVLGFDPFVSAEAMAAVGAHKCDSLEDLLARSDFVTVHVPLDPTTRLLLGRERLSMMKDGAYLVNVARGGIVDEVALARLLSSGHLAGAALDVFDEEPPGPSNPLLALDNVIVTPHMAALTRECAVRMAVGAARQVREVFCGIIPKHVVNPEVFEGLRPGQSGPG